jgi:hypothetical protein
MKRLLTLLFCLPLAMQAQWTHGPLRVTDDGHYLQYSDGTPFFWLGDTGWELFHRLTLAEARTYLDNRKKKGFNVIQAVILAEFDGLRKPNLYGQTPLIDLDPLKPNEAYFSMVDSVIGMAGKRGIYMGLLPTWGDKITKAWGAGPVVFDSVNAYHYGVWLGKRYRDRPNIIWILGGDRPARKDSIDYIPIWRQMARGLREGTMHPCIIAYHPSGGSSSSQWLQQEAWLDVNMFQSGHGAGHDVPCWEFVARDRALTPVKPTLDAEPNYEDHPVSPWPKWDPANGYFRDYDVRKQCYRSVFAGACGVTYGHHAVWQFYSPREEKINYVDRPWTDAIDRPGATQVGWLRSLIESHHAYDRIPDASLIVEGQGRGGEYAAAFRTGDDKTIMVYLPVGKKVVVNTSAIKRERISVQYFNPRNGRYSEAKTETRADRLTSEPATKEDWVLIVTAK